MCKCEIRICIECELLLTVLLQSSLKYSSLVRRDLIHFARGQVKLLKPANSMLAPRRRTLHSAMMWGNERSRSALKTLVIAVCLWLPYNYDSNNH